MALGLDIASMSRKSPEHHAYMAGSQESQTTWIIPSFHRSSPRVLGTRKHASKPRCLSLPPDIEDERSGDSSGSSSEPFSLFRLPKNDIYTLICLVVVNVFMYLCMSIMAPFFPEKVEEVGASKTVSGLVFASYALSVFVSTPVFARLLPFLGAKSTFLAGVFVAGSCNVLFGLLEYVTDAVTFTALAFTLRIIEGFGAGAFSTAAFAILAYVFVGNVPLVFGLVEASLGIGMTLGPAIGGSLYSVGGFGVPFYVVGSLMVATVPFTFWLLPTPEHIAPSKLIGTKRKFFKNPRVYVVSFTIIVTASVWSFLDPTLQPQLIQFDLSAAMIGLLFLLISATYALFSPFWGWVAEKFEDADGMMVIGLIVTGLTLFFLGPAPFLLPYLDRLLWLNIVCLAILGASIALTLIPSFESIRLATEEAGMEESISTYALVSGVWASSYALGEVLGPALGGYLDDIYQFSVCSAIFAFLCLAAAVILAVYLVVRNGVDRRRRKKEKAHERLRLMGVHSHPNQEYGAILPSEIIQRDTIPLLALDIDRDNFSSISAAATV